METEGSWQSGVRRTVTGQLGAQAARPVRQIPGPERVRKPTTSSRVGGWSRLYIVRGVTRRQTAIAWSAFPMVWEPSRAVAEPFVDAAPT